jgi:hypothetical protein
VDGVVDGDVIRFPTGKITRWITGWAMTAEKGSTRPFETDFVTVSVSEAGIRPAAISPLKVGWTPIVLVSPVGAISDATGLAAGAGTIALAAGLGEALLLGLGASPPQPETNNERQLKIIK